MSLRTKLLDNYKSELKAIQHMKADDPLTMLESSIWNFTDEHSVKHFDDSLIPIDEVITELERRIGILDSELCTEEEAKTLNY